MGTDAGMMAHLVVEWEEILFDCLCQQPAKTRNVQLVSPKHRLMSEIHAYHVKQLTVK